MPRRYIIESEKDWRDFEQWCIDEGSKYQRSKAGNVGAKIYKKFRNEMYKNLHGDEANLYLWKKKGFKEFASFVSKYAGPKSTEKQFKKLFGQETYNRIEDNKHMLPSQYTNINGLIGLYNESVAEGEDPDKVVTEITDYLEKAFDKYNCYTQEELKAIKEGSEIVCKQDGWTVVKVYNYPASEYYGKGSGWCTTGHYNDPNSARGNESSGKSMFKQYMDSDIREQQDSKGKYYLMYLNTDGRKYNCLKIDDTDTWVGTKGKDSRAHLPDDIPITPFEVLKKSNPDANMSPLFKDPVKRKGKTESRKRGNRNMRRTNRRVESKRRRVNECFGFGMTLNVLKDETGIADTDELLAKIDEFMADGNCNPFDGEECRNQFIDFVNNGAMKTVCPECGNNPCVCDDGTCADGVCVEPDFDNDEFYAPDEMPNVDDDVDLSLDDTLDGEPIDPMSDEFDFDSDDNIEGFADARPDDDFADASPEKEGFDDLPDVDEDEELNLDDTLDESMTPEFRRNLRRASVDKYGDDAWKEDPFADYDPDDEAVFDDEEEPFDTRLKRASVDKYGEDGYGYEDIKNGLVNMSGKRTESKSRRINRRK